MKLQLVSPVVWVGLGVLMVGGGGVYFLNSGFDSASTSGDQITSKTPETRSTDLTPAKSNGYTGVVGDVLTNQSFECLPRSEHEWYRTGHTFAVDPKNPQNMFVSVEYKGVYKSTNGGITWEQATKGIRAYSRQDDSTKGCYSEYPALEINPQDSNHLVIGLSSGGGGHLHPTNMNQQVGGVYQSFDAGESWELMIDNTMNTYVTDVIFDADGAIYYGSASNPGSWTEADQNKLFVSKGLIYKTTTKGATWSELPTGIGSRTSASYIFVNPKNTKQIMAPTYSAVRQSADGTGTGISTGKDTSVTQLGIFSSTDGGETWKSVLLPGNVPVLTASVSPNSFLHQYYVSASTTEGFVTFDGGVTFKKTSYMSIPVYDPFDSTSLHMLGYVMQLMSGGPGLNLHESFDGGVTWKPKGTLPAEIVSLQDIKTRVSNLFWHPSDKNTIYMNGASGYVWKSTDLGETWTRLLSYQDLN